MRKKIGILTGGGDVQALNTVINAAAQKSNELDIELVGILKGWEGLIRERYIDLFHRPIEPKIGGTVLKSSRTNINKIPHGPEIVLNHLKKSNISGLIVIGGEDTLSNSFSLGEFPTVSITKTIDNDVGQMNQKDKEFRPEEILNYFTLGFPTAAEKIASYVSLKEGLRTTAYSHERIVIVESMGMHAGWLALSSCMGSPDFIVIPEFPLNYELLLSKVAEKFDVQKNVIIVVAEGAKWNDGSFLCSEADEIEDFDHPRFGGSGNMLKKRLKTDLEKFFNTRNINSVNPSYLYRSGKPNDLDFRLAQMLGETAVEILSDVSKEALLLTVQMGKSGFHVQHFPLSKFNSIDDLHRFVDDRYYDPQNFQITENGKYYMSQIIPEFEFDDSYGIE